MIHCERYDRCSPLWRDADDMCAVQAEVFAPLIAPWVKQTGQLASHWIDACNVWAFVKVATTAGEREIFQGCGTAVLAGNNVIDREPQPVNALRH
jgi:hypothetical protein